MVESWKKGLVVAFGVFVVGLGYILVAEGVLSTWAALAFVAGGGYGAVGGVMGILYPLDATGYRVLRFTLAFVPAVPLLVHSGDATYPFLFATSLVMFGMVLQDVVDGWYNGDDGG